jgi:hypothetical protein
MCGAPECLTAFGARTFLVYHNNNGSESTIVKTVELTWVLYHVAEPSIPRSIFFAGDAKNFL